MLGFIPPGLLGAWLPQLLPCMLMLFPPWLINEPHPPWFEEGLKPEVWLLWPYWLFPKPNPWLWLFACWKGWFWACIPWPWFWFWGACMPWFWFWFWFSQLVPVPDPIDPKLFMLFPLPPELLNPKAFWLGLNAVACELELSIKRLPIPNPWCCMLVFWGGVNCGGALAGFWLKKLFWILPLLNEFWAGWELSFAKLFWLVLFSELACYVFFSLLKALNWIPSPLLLDWKTIFPGFSPSFAILGSEFSAFFASSATVECEFIFERWGDS